MALLVELVGASCEVGAVPTMGCEAMPIFQMSGILPVRIVVAVGCEAVPKF
jgi:hypothetical protein